MTKLEFCAALGEIDERYIQEAYSQRETARRWSLWVYVAACLCVLVVCGVGIAKLLGTGKEIVVLRNGETITFYKAEMGVGMLADLDVEIRELKEEELAALFGELPVTGFAYYDKNTQAFIGLEGEIDGTYGVDMTLSLPGQLLKDTVVEGEEVTSVLGGLPVAAGYTVIKSNGIAVYYMTLHFENCDIYIENGGKDRELLKDELVQVAEQLVELAPYEFGL